MLELYLYSSYGPYGLYRASVPVQGCTLYFFNNINLTYEFTSYMKISLSCELSETLDLLSSFSVMLNIYLFVDRVLQPHELITD